MASFMRDLNITSRCAAQYRADKLEKYGLNGYQHTYILNICRSPGITQEQLSKLIYINKSNVTRQLAILEQNGFIYRKPSENDKRAALVYPTEKAEEIYPIVQQTVIEWNKYVTSDFTPEELEMLVSMMEKVKNKAVDYVESRSEDNS